MAVDGKPVADSASEMIQLVLPNDTNLLGHLLGGTLTHWIDLIGAVVANRHSRRPIVTASMEAIDFYAPVRLGHLVILKGYMTYVGRSSMEVAVEVFAENGLTGERVEVSSAVLTYVALDDQGKPIPVPPLILKSDEERRRFSEGKERRRVQLERVQRFRFRQKAKHEEER
jgi:acyl-CoA hydrolase